MEVGQSARGMGGRRTSVLIGGGVTGGLGTAGDTAS